MIVLDDVVGLYYDVSMKDKFQLPVILIAILFGSITSCKKDIERDEIVSDTIPDLDALSDKIRSESDGEVVNPESSLIYRMEYFEKEGHLILHFQRNREQAYLYQNVPVKVREQTKSAGGKGTFFAKKIRDVETYQVKK